MEYQKCEHVDAKMRVLCGYANYTLKLYVIPIMPHFHLCKSWFVCHLEKLSLLFMFLFKQKWNIELSDLNFFLHKRQVYVVKAGILLVFYWKCGIYAGIWGMDFAYWWICIGKGLGLQLTQQACFWIPCSKKVDKGHQSFFLFVFLN